MKKLMSTIAITFILTGCTTSDVQNETTEQFTATINVIVEDELFHEQEVVFQEGSTLKEIMEEDIDSEFDGDFVTTIEGQSQNPETNTWWVFDVNDEMSQVGAHEYEPEDNDEIDWKLTEF